MGLVGPEKGLRAALNFSKIPGLRIFGVVYTIKNLPNHLSRQKLSNRDSALYLKIHERWAKRPTDCLWWQIGSQVLKKKRVVRSWLSRRCKTLVKDVLQSRGYDEEGRRLGESLRPGLTGSLELVPFVDVIAASDEDVRKEINVVVDHVEMACALNEKNAKRRKQDQSGESSYGKRKSRSIRNSESWKPPE